MTDKRQKATKVKCKCNESITKQNSQYLWNIFFSGRSSWVLLELFADEHNTFPKLTRRNVKLNKFAFRTPWLPDLLCKHWFLSSVWNFCRHWVAGIPPCESSKKQGQTAVFTGYRDTGQWETKPLWTTHYAKFLQMHKFYVWSWL